MKKLLFLVFVTVIFADIPPAFAEDVVVFHFEKNGEKLSLDSQMPQPITLETDPDFSIVDFSKNQSSGEYRIDLFDVSGAQAVSYEFSGIEGRFSYEMPHFGIVNGYKIYAVKNRELLLQGSLANFVRCNANNICEFEKGENLNTCLADCVSGNFSPETQKLLKQSNNIIKDPKSGEVLLQGIQSVPVTSGNDATKVVGGSNAIVLILSGIILLLVGIGVWVLVKLRKRNKQYGL